MSIKLTWFDRLFGFDKALASFAEPEPTPDWVRVASVRTDEEAAIVVGRLKHAEIPAVAMPEHTALTRHSLIPVPVPVYVPNKFADAALKLFEEEVAFEDEDGFSAE